MTRAPDADAVDSAIVALVRSSDLAGTMEPIWRYAVRDQWYIGHKAIFAAQSWRTLQSIGWQHAEPVLRSLVGIATGRLFRDGKARISAELAGILDRIGSGAEGWQVRMEARACVRSAKREHADDAMPGIAIQGRVEASCWENGTHDGAGPVSYR
jgi:hypothetical protein